MKRAMFYLTIVLIAIIGLGHSNNISALYIEAPNTFGIKQTMVVEDQVIMDMPSMVKAQPLRKALIFGTLLNKKYNI